jgi:predicted PurR-regulated permease PerM
MKKALWITVWIVCLFLSILSLQLFDVFLILAGFCALLGLLLFALLKKRQKVKFSGKIALLCITVVLASMFLNESLEESSIKRGTVIIQALSDYKKTYGELPQSLDNLVPAFMPEIPQTSMRITGTNFFYAKQGKEYLLGFSTASLTGYVYDSKKGVWQHRD